MPIFLFLLMTLMTDAMAMAAEPVWHDVDFAVSDELGVGNERVALLLRAKINQKDCHIQLDTGADFALRWHVKSHSDGAVPVPVIVQIGDVKREVPADAAVIAALQSDGCGGVIASVGNAFFDHGTLTLDFANERFAFLPGTGLRDHPGADPMGYVPSASGGGHPLIEVTLDSGRRGMFLLDTGAARFGLVATSAGQWDALTGGLPLRKSALVRSFKSTNAKDLAPSVCYDTLVAGSMIAGQQTLPKTMISYCQGKDFTLSRPIDGVMGMLPLMKRRVVIDYVAQRWLLSE